MRLLHSPGGCNPIVAPPHTENQTLNAALEFAAAGIPVMPCKPDKSPYFLKGTLEHGHLDATTDPHLLAYWWGRWPDALIGMPTGSRSGIWVLDVDWPEALGELPAHLPETYTAATPRDGRHFYLRHVEGITTSSGSLPDGIDVRGEGGYVIAPPSPGYHVVSQAPIADAPDWLLERTLKPRFKALEGGGEGNRSVPTGTRFVLRERIYEGTRNRTLYEYGCSLRAHGLDHAAILAELRRANAERCVPSLDDAEVREIAASAAGHAPGNATRVAPEVLVALKDIEAALHRRAWRGVGGKTERSVMVALVKTGRRVGTLIPAGVRVGIATRPLAEEAGMSWRSLMRAVGRLRQAGLIRKDDADRKPAEAGAFVLVHPGCGAGGRAYCHHSTTFVRPSGDLSSSSETQCASDDSLRAPRLRWGYWFGKTGEQVLDTLERLGAEATMGELAEALHVKRPRDLRRRAVGRLEEAGVVEVVGETVRLLDGWLDALEEARQQGDEVKAERMQKKRHEWEREGYRDWLAERRGEA